MQVSQYEDLAQNFLAAHPLGSVLSAAALQDWVTEKANGSTIAADLAIDDPAKRLTALRRHLNDGARSSNMAEEQRFVIQIEDAKAKTYIVRPLAAIAQEQADNAIGKSVVGALSPLKSSKRAIDAVKLDELPEIERKALEMARENVAAMEAAIKPTLQQEVNRIWIAEMGRRGIPAEHALKIRDALPAVNSAPEADPHDRLN